MFFDDEDARGNNCDAEMTMTSPQDFLGYSYRTSFNDRHRT